LIIEILQLVAVKKSILKFFDKNGVVRAVDKNQFCLVKVLPLVAQRTAIKKPTHYESEIINSVNELETGIPANEICLRLNISRPTLYQWKRKYFNPILKMG
jgi:predicted DNA-binding transcriptional regulator AlpA